MQSLLYVATLGGPGWVRVIASNSHSGIGQEPEYRFLLAQKFPLHIVPSSFPSSQPVNYLQRSPGSLHTNQQPLSEIFVSISHAPIIKRCSFP